MTYGVILKCKCCNHAVYNGSITYNLSKYFKDTFIGGHGLYWLDQKVASDCTNMLEYCVDNLNKIEEIENYGAPVDGWTSCAANAVTELQTLRKLCDQFPDHIWLIIG